ncbi:TlpA disulfide reductase family protein, partial [Rhodoferax sp.]|uniref:TlpA disulfide reductase family protein n=1 Tax=Rhodoferax sp. TaxID=50421 RepID=UPI00271617C9
MSSTRRHFLAGASAIAGAATWGHSGALFAQSAAASEAKAPPLPAPGTLLHLPEMSLLDGTVFRPAQAEGQVLVVYWWASTCPFCALQSPEIQKLWQSQRSRGLQMLTLSVDRKREDALAYL